VKKKKRGCFKKKKLISDEAVWHLLLFFWMLGIFILSSFEGSGKQYWDLRVFLERKGAHIFEFFVLAYLFWKVLFFYRLKYKKQIQLTFLLSLFCASWDEAHQLFVFGREGKLTDIGIDLIGIILFFIAAKISMKMRPTKKPGKLVSG